MHKIYISAAIAVLGLLTTNVAVAQSYTYPYFSNTGCVSISKDLSQGSRSSDVTSLQNFLLAQNYPGSGSWMVTGYFGTATRQAVLNFQSQRGLAQTGIADTQTRAAISSLTCGGSSNAYFSNVGYYNSAPIATPAPSYTYANTGDVFVNALSVNSGSVGTSVTIYGGGFDAVYNNVYFGNIPVTGNIASNGNSLTFTVPASLNAHCTGFGCYIGNQYVAPGTYQIYVTNARGTSNSLPFTVTSGGVAGCPWYMNSGSNCGSWGGGAYWNANIASMYPTSGGVGTSVTVFGSGFTQRGNSVHFGTGVITNLTSSDGTSLSFVVPTQLTGYGSQTLSLGTYNVSVTNERGATSNALPFTVTSVAQNAFLPSVASVNGPSTLAVGAQGTWTITLNTYGTANVWASVRWGDENFYPNSSVDSRIVPSSSSQLLTFTHTYQTGGIYTVVFTVTDYAGRQNTATAIVSVSPYGGTNQLTLTSITPVSGRVGTLISLIGTGFTYSGNTVHFGTGGTANLTSSNSGTTLYFTIPAYISPCDVNQGTVCPQYAQQVTAGTYPIYVSNAAGQTAALNFTII